MEGAWSGDWQNDPELMQHLSKAKAKALHKKSTALPKSPDDSPPTYLGHVSDSDGFLVGTDIKPRESKSLYRTGLFARLGLYCYNFQKGTDLRLKVLKRCYEQHGFPITKFFITLAALNPLNPQHRLSPLTLETCVQFGGFSQPVKTWWETCVCRLEGNEEADHEWNYEAISHHYKGEMPDWYENHQNCYYEVTPSQLLGPDYWWLHLFPEFAFFSRWSGTLAPMEIEDSLPLKTQKVVVETPGEGAIKPSEMMLMAPNAIFYISFTCGNDPATGELANYRAVVRKTMDGKPGHMRLEASCVDSEVMAEKASSVFQTGISRASSSLVQTEIEREREATRKLLESEYYHSDEDEDDSDLIRDENLAYGFDLDFSGYGPVTLVKSTWGVDFEIAIFARLGLHCYNFHEGTNYKFLRWEKYNATTNLDLYITLEAEDPSSPSPISFQTLLNYVVACTAAVTTWRTLASRIKCNEALDDYWDDTSINPFYKCKMPRWLAQDHLSRHNKYFYVVQESEIQENEWLHLFTEIAFYVKTEHVVVDASPPLVIKKVVVETKEEYKSEAREKLKADNALFYISYESNNPTRAYQAIVRKTMDGKPGHMSLDVADRTEG